MARRLPLFPLDVVLFPGTLLPLHIFEPRYRDLLRDCLAADRRFGILPPGEDGAPPPPGTVGTTARIRGTHPLEDGRVNIVVSGETRFRLAEYPTGETTYLMALVDLFEDEPGGENDPPPERIEALRELGERTVTALRTLTGAVQTPDWSPEPGTLSFQVASLLQVDRDFKYRFLGIRSAAHRVVLLLELLPSLVADLEARAAVRTRASGNGKGGDHPSIQELT